MSSNLIFFQIILLLVLFVNIFSSKRKKSIINWEKINNKFNGILTNLPSDINSNNSSELYKKYEKIITVIIDFLNEHNLTGTENNYFNTTECYRYLTDNNTNAIELIKIMFRNSGFSLSNDQSRELKCDSYNFTSFTLFTYQLKHGADEYFNNEYREVYKFINMSINFETGICIISQCVDLLFGSFSKRTTKDPNLYYLNKNSFLIDVIKDFIDIETLGFAWDDSLRKGIDRFSYKYIYFIICLSSSLVFLLIRVIITIYAEKKMAISFSEREIQENNKKKPLKENNISDNNTIINSGTESNASSKNNLKREIEEGLIDENINNYNNNIPSIIYSPTFALKEKLYGDFSRQNSKLNKLLSWISLMKNMTSLIETKSDYFNDTDLGLINLFQIICMFLNILQHTFYSLKTTPSQDYFSSDFYGSYMIFLIKISSYSYMLYIVLDGFRFGFKFMNYYKKYFVQSNEMSEARVAFSFMITCLPRFFMFFLTFFLVDYFIINYLGLFISMHTYMVNPLRKFKDVKCISESPFKYFLAEYHIYSRMGNADTVCIRSAYVSEHELISFAFMILLIYLCIKLKSRKFECFIFLSFFLNIVLSFLSFEVTDKYDRNFNTKYYQPGYKYIFEHLASEWLSRRYLHLFVNYFAMGTFAGILHFYNRDLSRSQSVLNENYPFPFFKDIVIFITRLSSVCKYILICFFGLIVLAISFVYTIYVYKNNPNGYRLSFTIDYFVSFILKYEVIICDILILFIIILLLCFNSPFLKDLSDSHLISLFSRLSYVGLCSYELLVQACLLLNSFRASLTVPDLLFVSTWNSFFVIFVALLMVLIFETPLRVLARWLRMLVIRDTDKKSKN